MASIPDSHHDLFEAKTFAHFATLMPDGTPHVTPVWVDYDEDSGQVLINTMEGRLKERNVRRDERVGVSMLDPEDPYRYCSIRGEVVEMTTDGAVEHADSLAQRYMDIEEYPNHEEEDGDRMIVRIQPETVVAH